jgi:hypothetical protein
MEVTMRRMILACALTGMALLFGAAPTPGLAGEAGVQFVGYRHRSYDCLPIITAVTTRNAAVITSIMTATHTTAAVDTITRSAITAVVAFSRSSLLRAGLLLAA